MSYFLVVTTSFQNYKRGTIIGDPTLIAGIRSSEYSNLAVLVSDEVVPPPEPPVVPDYNTLVAQYNQLAQTMVDTQAALVAILSVNSQQTASLASQQQQLVELSNSFAALAARVDGNTGTPVPPNLADDLPLAENDGLVLVTNRGGVLVGDLR